MIDNDNRYTRTVRVLNARTALKALGIGLEQGASMGVPFTITIVGPTLEPIAVVSDDGATPHSRETSRRKAQTAASTRRATGWMNETLAVQLPLGTGNLLTNVLGGVPVAVDGQVVAGLGVAGGTVEQDFEIAKAIIEALALEKPAAK